MLKILSIHWGLSIGGVGKYATLIEQTERYRDVTVHSLCILSRRRQVDQSTLDGLRNKTVIWRNSIFDLSWVKPAMQKWREWRPDLVMSNGFNAHFITSMLKRRIGSNVPLICSYHGEYHATTPLRRLPGIIYGRYTLNHIRNKVIGVVPVAEYCGRFLTEQGVDPGKIKVIHNGIDDIPIAVDGRDALRAEWGINKNEILIGVASRLDPVKGLEYLLPAFAANVALHPQARLVIIGTGTVEHQLKVLASVLNIEDKVIFAGFRTDMDRCFAAFDIFALPSLAEYHSIGLLEAMRAGKSIVASSVGGNTESVRDGKEAIVVPPADTPALTRALSRLLGDADLRDQMAVAARNRFKSTFTVEKMLQQTAEWFLACAKSASR